MEYVDDVVEERPGLREDDMLPSQPQAFSRVLSRDDGPTSQISPAFVDWLRERVAPRDYVRREARREALGPITSAQLGSNISFFARMRTG